MAESDRKYLVRVGDTVVGSTYSMTDQRLLTLSEARTIQKELAGTDLEDDATPVICEIADITG